MPVVLLNIDKHLYFRKIRPLITRVAMFRFLCYGFARRVAFISPRSTFDITSFFTTAVGSFLGLTPFLLNSTFVSLFGVREFSALSVRSSGSVVVTFLEILWQRFAHLFLLLVREEIVLFSLWILLPFATHLLSAFFYVSREMLISPKVLFDLSYSLLLFLQMYSKQHWIALQFLQLCWFF